MSDDDKMREALAALERLALHCNSATGEAREGYQGDYRLIRGTLTQQPESDRPWIELAACLYQACGAYDLPERILDVLSLAQHGEPFGHLIDGLLPCSPEGESDPSRTQSSKLKFLTARHDYAGHREERVIRVSFAGYKHCYLDRFGRVLWLNGEAEAAAQVPEEANPYLVNWPLKDCVQELVRAANILLNEKDYDGHGHEFIATARDCAIAHLSAAPSIAEKPSPAAKKAWNKFQSMLADDDPAKDHSIAEKREQTPSWSRKDAHDAYRCLRQENSTIPDEVIDYWLHWMVDNAASHDVYESDETTRLRRPEPQEVQS